jgi:hypothetical protein
MKVHFALNLVENGTPDNVETAGILEPYGNIEISDVNNLVDVACKNYINEISSIRKDISKTRVF